MTSLLSLFFRISNLWNWDDGEGILTPYNDDCFLMQYTGLKDKNGKEIYEGDVVAESMRTDVVTYNLSGFIPFAFADFGDEAYSAIDCEVIGNIYENPELIT